MTTDFFELIEKSSKLHTRSKQEPFNADLRKRYQSINMQLFLALLQIREDLPPQAPETTNQSQVV